MSLYNSRQNYEIRSDDAQKRAFWIRMHSPEPRGLDSMISYGPYKSKQDAEDHAKWLSGRNPNESKNT